MADFGVLAASGGAEAVGRLDAADRRVMSLLAAGDGLDRSAVMLVKYSEPSMRALAVPVTDSGRLTGALTGAGWESTRDGLSEVYSLPGESYRMVCDGPLMWVVSASTDERAVNLVKALRGRGGDAPAWLADSIAAAGASVYMSVAAADSSCYLCTLTLDGTRGSIAVSRAASGDGRMLNLIPGAPYHGPGSVLAAVDTTATVALAMALPPSFDIAGAVDRATGGMYLDPAVGRAIADLDGRLALSVDFGGTSLTDPASWRAAIALGTASGRSGAVVGAVADMLAAVGVPLTRSGAAFSLGAGGNAMLSGGVRDSSTVMVSTPGYPAAALVADRWAVPGRLRAVAPAGSPLASLAGLDGCGLRVDAMVVMSRAEIEIDFTGSRKGFVANVLDVLHAID